jgi:hypothetical protein
MGNEHIEDGLARRTMDALDKYTHSAEERDALHQLFVDHFGRGCQFGARLRVRGAGDFLANGSDDEPPMPPFSCAVSSVKVEPERNYDRVHVWTRGQKAGELLVNLGDGLELARRLTEKPVLGVRPEALFQRFMRDGFEIVIYPIFGGVRVCYGKQNAPDIIDSYYYQDPERAIEAAMLWDGQSDPLDGWFRHLGSGRRRENGDPTKEKIQW